MPSKLAEMLAARAIEVMTVREESKATNPLDNYSQESLEEGVGMMYGQMTVDERKKARDRKHKQRVRQAKHLQDQIHEAINVDEADAEDEQSYDQERYVTAMTSLARWYPTIRRVAFTHYKRIERYLGNDRDTGVSFGYLDVAQETYLRLARQVARSDMSLARIARDITWMNEQYKGVPTEVPGTHPEAQWLASRARLYAKWATRNLYRENPSITSIEAIDTIYASTGGIDQLISSTKADHPPSMCGYRFLHPGETDPLPLAALIDNEFVKRNLEGAVELLINTDRLSDGRPKYRRLDGSFRWTTYGTKMLALLGEEPSREATPQLIRMQAIRSTRRHFEWLPSFIDAAIDAINDGRMPHAEYEWALIAQFPDPEAMARAVSRHAEEILEILTK